MKILQINSVYGYASTGKIVATIHENILKEGHESYVIYSRKTPHHAISENVTRIYSPLGVAMHAALAVVFDRHGLYSKHSTQKIIQRIDEINPDIVHLHVIHGFYLNYPMLFDYLKSKNKKIIWTLHDCWEYTGYCAYYDYNECQEWKTGCKTCKYRNTYPYRVFSNSVKNFECKKKAVNGAEMILVSPSKWLDHEVSQSMLMNFDHQVINNDIDFSKFYFETSSLREEHQLTDKKIILAVANIWTTQKGFLEIIKLAKLVELDTKIVMIGCSKAQLKKLPANILGFERVQLDELRKWYSAADLFVNCTLEDNYPTVNLEAKACGLPIISYKTGGSPEILDENDVVVDKYGIQEIANYIKNTATFSKRSVVREQEMFAQYMELYKTVLNK